MEVEYTFLNEQLAKHYGVANVTGPQFRRVTSSPTSGTPETLVRARQILRSTPQPRWSQLIAAVVGPAEAGHYD